MPNYIQIHEHNLRGTHVVADLHGLLNTLKTTLKGLTPKETLYLVGDLIDKGPESKELVLALINIIEANQAADSEGKKRSYPQIYVALGNHEYEFICLIEAIESVLEKGNFDPETEIEKACAIIIDACATDDQLKFNCDPQMGGKWAIDLYIEELKSGKIVITPRKKIEYQEDSDISKFYQFFRTLPLMYLVKGNVNRGIKPFYVVHADMPFDDNTVFEVITGSRNLTPEEVDHALNGRPELVEEGRPPFNTNRTKDSITAVVGHSVVCHRSSHRAVREETNTFNLDTGSFHYEHFLLANMTTRQCYFYTPHQKEPYWCDYITNLASLVNESLQGRPIILAGSPYKKPQKRRRMDDDATNPGELESFLEADEQAPSASKSLYMGEEKDEEKDISSHTASSSTSTTSKLVDECSATAATTFTATITASPATTVTATITATATPAATATQSSATLFAINPFVREKVRPAILSPRPTKQKAKQSS